MRCNIILYFIRNIISAKFGFLIKNRHLGFICRYLYIYRQPHFKTSTQTFTECLHFFRRTIRRYYNLLSVLIKCIKSMEEFFLSRFLTYNKLDIIDKKNVNVSVLFTEFRVLLVLYGINQLIGKCL